tara:strand:- start:370 stop:2307 length:1938 start_codon:yes stop_codon:yes gene_type:complete
MAGKKLSVTLTLNDRQFQSGLRKASKSMKKFGSGMKSAGRSLSTNLTLPLVAFGAASIAAFDKQAKAIAQVEAGLRSTGATVGFTSKQLQQMAAGLQKKTLFGDEVILKDATAQLLTFTNITGTQFERTQMAALDLATRLDGDLKGASIQLGKALNDPVANLSALSRSGIQFSEEQKATIKTLAETNRLADAQTLILDELEKQYGGSAEAAAQAGAGGIIQLKNELGDLMEEIGEMLMPILIDLGEIFKDIIGAFKNLSPESQKTTVVIGILAGALGPLLTVLGSIVGVVMTLGIKFIAIAAAIAALALGVLFVNDNWEAFIERFSDINWWRNALIDMIQFLVENSPIGLFIKGINAALKLLGRDQIPNPFEGIADALDHLKGETKEYETQFDDFGTFIENQGKKIKKALVGVGDAFNVGGTFGGGGGGSSQPTKPKPQEQGERGRILQELSEIGDIDLDLGEEDAELEEVLEKEMELIEMQKKLAESAKATGETFKSAFSSMAASADASFGDIAAAAGNAARQVIKTQVAEATSAFAAKIFASVPFPFNLALASAAGSVVGSLFNKIIPPFADGGMVSGATLAMVGEGPGTSAINPEVIAPLDKLQGMIGNSGGQVQVVGKISGSDILLASDRARGNRNRTRGF